MKEIHKKFNSHLFEATYLSEDSDDGLRLDLFIKNCFPNFSREFIKRKIRLGEISISSRKPPHRPNAKVRANEKIIIKTFNKDEEKVFWDGKLVELTKNPPIIFNHDDMVIISKPPFMVTHPTGRRIFHSASVILEDKLNCKVHSIHRIDRETSGLLIFGKNSKASHILSSNFENNKVKKCYFLIGKKDPKFQAKFPFMAKENLETTKVAPLTFAEKQQKSDTLFERMITTAHESYHKDSPGKSAQTRFIQLFENETYVLALAFPHTGRQHQIRVHAQFHGFPLLGDKLYGSDPSTFSRFQEDELTSEDIQELEIPRQALHALAISFPYKEKQMTFFDTLPADLKTWIKKKLFLDTDELEKKIITSAKNYFSHNFVK